MRLDVRLDDLSSEQVHSLISAHISGMQNQSPEGHVHALAMDGLKAPEISFFVAWEGEIACGCGALKATDAATGEVKSMRTRAGFLRRGVGQAVLDAITEEAIARVFTLGVGDRHRPRV